MPTLHASSTHRHMTAAHGYFAPLFTDQRLAIGGAGTNLKGGRRKFFFRRTPPLFGSKTTISRFGER